MAPTQQHSQPRPEGVQGVQSQEHNPDQADPDPGSESETVRVLGNSDPWLV
jgi:hypothetical protein